MKPDGRKRNLLAGFCAALFLLAIPCLVVAEESDYGYVIVTTDADDATLYVDGAYAGKLPMLDTLKLPVGKHLLSFLPGSRTSKLYPIGDDIPTLITTTKETEVEYPGFHVHVTLVGGGTATDLYKNDDKGKKEVENDASNEIKKDENENKVDPGTPTDIKKDNNENKVDPKVSTDLTKDQDKDKDKDKDDQDKDKDRDDERDYDRDRDRDRDRDHDRDYYPRYYHGPDKVVTTTTSTTGLNVSYNERRIIESASCWVYVQSQGTTPVYMDYSEYTGTVDKINLEARRRNQLFWGCVGGGAALIGVVVILAVVSQ